jgi:hypothetical protein
MKYTILSLFLLSITISGCNNASRIDVNNIKTACEFVDAFGQIADRVIELNDKHGDVIFAELKLKGYGKGKGRDIFNEVDVKNVYTKEFLKLYHIAAQLDSLDKRRFLNREKQACPNSFEIDGKRGLMYDIL